MRAFPTISILILGVSLAACGGDDTQGDDGVEPRVTWYQDVGPIVATHCMGCHQAGGIAPFSLTDYESAAEQSSRMLSAVETGLMPPWDAEDAADCTPTRRWKDDPRLTAAETDTLRQWIADGTPAGTEATLPTPPSTAMTGVTDTVRPVTPYATSGLEDEFVCFIMDTTFTDPVKWLTGLQVRPGNDKVVHHAVITVMRPGTDLTALKAEHGTTPWKCNNPMTSMDTYLLGVWTPGNQPMQTDDTLSIPILRGSSLIMQIHYHPANQVNDPDATSVDMRLTDTWPQKMYTYGAWGNAFSMPDLLADPDDRGDPEFRIPANSATHGEHMRFTMPSGLGDRVPLFAAYPHMHYIGVGLQVRIERAAPRPGEPAEECLVNVPRWNFDWQRAYQYDASFDTMPMVSPGDTIDVRCTYDNTLANPFVQRALHDAGLSAPIDVFLGEQTLDEMCLGIFGLVFDAPAEPPSKLTPPESILMPPLLGGRH